MTKRLTLLSCILLTLALTACGSSSGSDPKDATGNFTPAPQAASPASIRLEKLADGFTKPLHLVEPPDGSGRLFLVEQGGLIKVIKNGVVLRTPFIDLSGIITDKQNEQGLLGLAFHPDYAKNGRFFVTYTAVTGDNTLAEFAVSPPSADTADPATRAILLTIKDTMPNHNGGMVTFGPDGYLYFGTGDGGGSGDPAGNGQNTNALLGKILRLDVNGTKPYAVPPSNPFATSGGRPEVWAYGLRNPWRFSFDRATGDLWIGDVGQDTYEEVDLQPANSAAGRNYGWNVMEGAHCFTPKKDCATAGKVLPVHEYTHDDGCSVTGGFVYHGAAIPALTGTYVFSDYCTGDIWLLAKSADGSYARSTAIKADLRVTSFGEDHNGELYVLSRYDGAVYRILPK